MNLMRNAAHGDWRLDYGALHLPVLVITGLQDRVFLDLGVVDRLFARLPDARARSGPRSAIFCPGKRPSGWRPAWPASAAR